MPVKHGIDVVRVYEDQARQVGDVWVLVDRLWPRRRTKASIDFDQWLRDVAPSTELRTWYGHDRTRFDVFRERYRDELSREPAHSDVASLRALLRHHRVVLLTATRDVEHSSAMVLRDVVQGTAPSR